MTKPSTADFDRQYQTHLKHLKLKGLQPKTIEAYSRAIRRIGAYFDHRIDDLTEPQLTHYFTELLGTHSWSAVKLDLYGLKFYTQHVLKKPWGAPGLIKPPKSQRLPDIVTIDEARRIFAATRVVSYRVFFFTLYSLGLRLGEGLRLQVGDIDAVRWRVHVRDAKGNKDRLVPLSVHPPRYHSVKDELADFARHGEAYRWYESAAASGLPSTDLRRVLLDFDVSTALPLILFLELEADLDADQKADCLAAVESFIARRVLTGEETKEYNKLFVEVVGALRGTKGAAVLPALNKKLLTGGGATRTWPTDAEVVEKAISRLVFKEIKTPALRLILERLELWFRSKKSENTEIPPGLQIEHVLPQKWATYWPLRDKAVPADVMNFPHLAKDDLEGFGDSVRARNAAVQTLGNLTLLNQYLNPAASNGSFEMKKIEYKNSVLRLNRYFDVESGWNEEHITVRGKLLGEAICKIWPRATTIAT